MINPVLTLKIKLEIMLKENKHLLFEAYKNRDIFRMQQLIEEHNELTLRLNDTEAKLQEEIDSMPEDLDRPSAQA